MSDSPSARLFDASSRPQRPRAIVYCEANFGEIDGKTANGLVRNSEKYEIVSVIDSRLAGQDAGLGRSVAPPGPKARRGVGAAQH